MTATKIQTASEALGDVLLDLGWMMGCAESCTGGLLAGAITSMAGSSQWFERGFVTYSNAAKVQNLRVNEATLERFGAVSEETAMEMAAGVLMAARDAQFAISTTGIAGPGGATAGKPVGMVCFGFAQRVDDGFSTRAVTRIFEGDRGQVRESSVLFALINAIEIIRPR